MMRPEFTSLRSQCDLMFGHIARVRPGFEEQGVLMTPVGALESSWALVEVLFDRLQYGASNCDDSSGASEAPSFPQKGMINRV